MAPAEPSAYSIELSVRAILLFLMEFVPLFSCSLLLAPRSLLFNDLVRPKQNGLWNCDTDLLGCFQIDEQRKLSRLLNW